jgi:hypothetical protein
MTGRAAVRKEQDPSELRRAKRDLVSFSTQATGRSGTHSIHVVNISPLGLMARTDIAFLAGDSLRIDLPHLRAVEAIVRWVEDGRIGTEFTRGIDTQNYDAMLAFMPERQKAW